MPSATVSYKRWKLGDDAAAGGMMRQEAGGAAKELIRGRCAGRLGADEPDWQLAWEEALEEGIWEESGRRRARPPSSGVFPKPPACALFEAGRPGS